MALLQEWRDYAYSDEMQNSKEGEKLWQNYFTLEKGIYEQLLSDPSNVVEGTVEELAAKYDVLRRENPIDTMEKDTLVRIDIDPEKLYYNMVECKAEWLYTLPQWDEILTAERRKELYKEQKNSGTIHNENRKVGRNDPCPCGSGKKYKQCCGR